MARLKSEFLERVDQFCDRIIHVAAALEPRRSRRIVDQLIGSGTSVGANLYEADEAMSRSDFVKSACISVKELNETRFWIRLIERQGWIPAARLQPLEHELLELKKILGTMISRTKAGSGPRLRAGPRI